MNNSTVSDFGLGFSEPITAVVIGARGGLGEAFVNAIAAAHPQNQVVATSRNEEWCAQPSSDSTVHRQQLDVLNEDDWARLCALLAADAGVNCVINASGLLHGEGFGPERSWRELCVENMSKIFAVNTYGVGLAIRYLIPLMDRAKRGVFASLSARVGSIGDNQLGGWYSYRASKAAQNMFIKCAALEAKRLRPHLVCAVLQPGTVASDLSAPFTQRKPPGSVFTPEESVGHLMGVLSTLTAQDTSAFLAWDGQSIPW